MNEREPSLNSSTENHARSDEAGTWNRLASRYDLIARIFGTSYGRVRDRLKEDVPPDSKVVEVAAGTGQFTRELAERSAHLLTTDVSPDMVARLRERLPGQSAGRVDCLVRSAYDLELPQRSVDVVFCANALHIMDDPHRALAEFRRVLRTDGLLIAPTFLHGVSPVRRLVSRGLSLVSPFVAKNRFDLSSLTHAIETGGFRVTYQERMPGLFPLGYVLARPDLPPQEHGGQAHA